MCLCVRKCANDQANSGPMKILLALLAGAALVSCATGPFYPQGPPDLSKSALFLAQTKTEGSVFRQTLFVLGEIDGMSRGRTVRFPNGEKGIAVTPGDHRICVGILHGEPGKGLVRAEGTLPMKVQAVRCDGLRLPKFPCCRVWGNERGDRRRHAMRGVVAVAIRNG